MEVVEIVITSDVLLERAKMPNWQDHCVWVNYNFLIAYSIMFQLKKLEEVTINANTMSVHLSKHESALSRNYILQGKNFSL